jgi:hypothetical protein
VPSRLYYLPSSEKPLSGKRIAVKDIFHIKGVRTTVSSRDFRAFFCNAKETAPMIQRLIDAGAVIIGTTKTAQFLSGELAPDWVDYSCPFNPRGDGYMEPDCSSTGSAVAAAAYDWVDVTVGSDSEQSHTLASVIRLLMIQCSAWEHCRARCQPGYIRTSSNTWNCGPEGCGSCFVVSTQFFWPQCLLPSHADLCQITRYCGLFHTRCCRDA